LGRSSELAVIDRLFRWGAAVGDDDARLLERFRDGRDEAAFAALMDRHGPMVLGVCRRALRDGRDVEDAFQATFLILARRAATIRGAGGVGPWLHGVARRVATRARADSARRFVREGVRLEVEPSADASPGREAESVELRAVIDDELDRLPPRFRDPVILCHLEGLTHDQAADRLRLPVGTVRSRLARGRSRLRDSLERRGLSAADAPSLLPFAEPLSPALLEATLKSSLASASAPASTLAAALADGVLQTMFIAKAKLAAVALGTILALGGASVHALQQSGAVPADAASQEPPASPKQEAASLPDPSTVETKPPEPAAEAPATGSSGPRSRGVYLFATDHPRLMSLEDGHVVTAFVISDYVSASQSAPGKTAAAPRDPKTLKVGESDRRSVRLAAEASAPIQVVPVSSGTFDALLLQGDQIERIAVRDGTGWSIQELREPTRAAAPMVNPSMASYAIGRRIYNYSHPARRWDVLELPEGAEPMAGVGNDGDIMLLKYGDQYHRYDVRTGRWSRLDIDIPPDLGRQLEQQIQSTGGFR
jgi:RNA polymerase sigma factor (sigma-70 family)